ncbi:hypothetical protein LTR36_009047 [Oleoguttula mirabilis]|uniref:Major facilitator superfamily (MFS) profile domain-containing protein n=1 Tax=Oleoguttula mirabilis TaxID=1507867 RepID=A0AAV9J6I1_9PEZI|nr:hypothetical protein LTR36_009047 [Oleoguttula mirabilis]
MAVSADPTKDQSGVSAANETTPLLLAPESVPAIQNGKTSPPHPNGHANGKQLLDEDDASARTTIQPDEADEEEERPMPYSQILLLCYASLAEPVAYFAIFPFMPEMIHRTGGLDQADIGFWTGLIESLFSLVQMVLMIFYGRAADKLGRKPVLVFSLAGISVFTALFGMSQTLWQMILFRCMAGLFAGSVVTIRTMISENCTKQSQARAFSWYMFTRNLGIFIGPLIGGSLANPADLFPHTFGHSAFFKQYPYALATWIAGAVCLTATLAALFGLKETLKRKGEPGSQDKPEMTTWQVLSSPGVPIVLYIFGHTMLLALAYTAVSPVFLYTNISLGGFGFSDQWIAIFIAVAGGSQSLWMLLAFPPLQKRFGTGNLLRACAVAWPFMMASFPILNEFLRHGLVKAFWVIAPISLVIGSGVAMAFACVQLCINDISPSSTVLATVNALSLTVNSGVRAFAPVAFTSIYAAGVKLGWADGHLIWFFLVAIALALNVAVYFLPERAEGRYKKKQPADDDQ